jgi:hypothetical protein
LRKGVGQRVGGWRSGPAGLEVGGEKRVARHEASPSLGHYTTLSFVVNWPLTWPSIRFAVIYCER